MGIIPQNHIGIFAFHFPKSSTLIFKEPPYSALIDMWYYYGAWARIFTS